MTTSEDMITDTNIAWLSGIIDGEGTLFVYRGGNKKSIPVFRIFLVNSDMAMMTEAQRIMSEMCNTKVKVKPKYYNEKNAVIKGNLDMWVIEICRQEYVLAICKALLPYLVAKKDKAKFFIHYLSRHKKGMSWLDEELESIFRGVVETKSWAPSGRKDEAIVRACGKP